MGNLCCKETYQAETPQEVIQPTSGGGAAVAPGGLQRGIFDTIHSDVVNDLVPLNQSCTASVGEDKVRRGEGEGGLKMYSSKFVILSAVGNDLGLDETESQEHPAGSYSGGE